ncbi:MAG TPA: hypothetical protein DDY11_09775 [Leclercia adecarboxylata]|nr:hypothetical protein [Leclercia adecarboxylata]
MRKHSRKKKNGLCVTHSHAQNHHFYRVSEIYAWCGQMPFVMLMAASGQRSSYHITPIESLKLNNRRGD